MSGDAVRRSLQALADRNKGKITPQGVVDAARSPQSALHSFFTWSDDEAARLHRLNEARSLIRSVKIEVSTREFAVEAPAYVRDPEADVAEQGYVSFGRLRDDADLAREAVVGEFARAAASLRRAKTLAVALGIGEQIDQLLGQVERLRYTAESMQAGDPHGVA